MNIIRSVLILRGSSVSIITDSIIRLLCILFHLDRSGHLRVGGLSPSGAAARRMNGRQMSQASVKRWNVVCEVCTCSVDKVTAEP